MKFVSQPTVKDSEASIGKQSTIRQGTLPAKKQGPSEFINMEIQRIKNMFQDVAEEQPDLKDLYQPKFPESLDQPFTGLNPVHV